MNLARRIKTVQNTSKITKAMSLVSAGQNKKAKSLLANYQGYSQLLEEIMSNLAYKAKNRFDDQLEMIILDQDITRGACRKFLHLPPVYNYPKLSKDLFIILTSDKGLCGGFNSSLIKFFKEKAPQASEVIMIGKKGYDILSRDKNYSILENNYLDCNIKFIQNDIVLGKITKKILERITEGYEKVFIIYNHFISMLKQVPSLKQLFPILVKPSSTSDLYTCDSNPMDSLAKIIPQYLHREIYEALMNNSKSETAKRMMTMDQASENSKEMLTSLKLQYNRQRQAKVTRELIEVISGIQK
jgi:F-type H+-transporting ATPase subunit gamma